MSQSRISTQLNAARRALQHVQTDSEVLALLVQHGFPAGAVAEGRDLYEAALGAVEAQRSAAAAHQVAFRLRVVVEHGARDAHQTLAQVARAVLSPDLARIEALGLKDSFRGDDAAFIPAAYRLFTAANEIPDLLRFGYDTARLESEREKIAAFEACLQNEQATRLAARKALTDQDTVLEALRLWMEKFNSVARVAFRGRPRMLEKVRPPAPASGERGRRVLPVSSPKRRRAGSDRAGKK